MVAITYAHGGDLQMIGVTRTRVHHSDAAIENTAKIAILDDAGEVLLQKPHAVNVDDGLPVKLVITPCLGDIANGTMVLFDLAFMPIGCGIWV
jgi:hypothetical protein